MFTIIFPGEKLFIIINNIIFGVNCSCFSHPMYVPFQKELFSDLPFDPALIVPLAPVNQSHPQVFSTDSVSRTMRPGERREDITPRVDEAGNAVLRPTKERRPRAKSALPKPAKEAVSKAASVPKKAAARAVKAPRSVGAASGARVANKDVDGSSDEELEESDDGLSISSQTNAGPVAAVSKAASVPKKAAATRNAKAPRSVGAASGWRFANKDVDGSSDEEQEENDDVFTTGATERAHGDNSRVSACELSEPDRQYFRASDSDGNQTEAECDDFLTKQNQFKRKRKWESDSDYIDSNERFKGHKRSHTAPAEVNLPFQRLPEEDEEDDEIDVAESPAGSYFISLFV
jgi:hypothetical protein